jgi:quinolinate synthase
MIDMGLKDKVLELKNRKGAVILVHNYQIGEVQEIADHIGDSLGLARIAMEAERELIVFCGVRFMAETAKILNPEAKVLIPRDDATCPMADMIQPADVERLRSEYPGAMVCSYVNTNADVKAVTDVCCTSANAVEVVRGLRADGDHPL